MARQAERHGIFREEAVVHYLRDADSPGLLRTGPIWTRAMTLISMVLLAALLALVVFVARGHLT